MWDTAGLATGIAAVRQGGAAPIVRVPLGDIRHGRAASLDFGAEGIIAPMINTAADARAFVAAAKFPPIGERSWGPHRAAMLAGIADQKVYLANANDNIVTLAMIETRTALANLDAIAATPGIDGAVPRAVRPFDRIVRTGRRRSAFESRGDRARSHRRGGAEGRQDPGRLLRQRRARALALAKRGMRFLARSAATWASCAPARAASSRS